MNTQITTTNMNNNNNIVYKIYLNNNSNNNSNRECRKFKASGNSIDSLKQTIASILNLKTFSLSYMDSDGDQITMDTDNDLQLYINESSSSSSSSLSVPHRPLVLIVTPVPAISLPSPSPSSEPELESAVLEESAVEPPNSVASSLRQELHSLQKQLQSLRASKLHHCNNNHNNRDQHKNQVKDIRERIQQLQSQLKPLLSTNNNDNDNANTNNTAPKCHTIARAIISNHNANTNAFHNCTRGRGKNMIKHKVRNNIPSTTTTATDIAATPPTETEANLQAGLNGEQKVPALNTLHKQRLREQMQNKKALQLQTIQNIRANCFESITLLKQQIRDLKAQADLDVAQIKQHMLQPINDSPVAVVV
jgi:hypothetical protein